MQDSTTKNSLSLERYVIHLGKKRIVEQATGDIDNPQELGRRVAEKLRKNGAHELMHT